jgi:hypothetical protein
MQAQHAGITYKKHAALSPTHINATIQQFTVRCRATPVRNSRANATRVSHPHNRTQSPILLALVAALQAFDQPAWKVRTPGQHELQLPSVLARCGRRQPLQHSYRPGATHNPVAATKDPSKCASSAKIQKRLLDICTQTQYVITTAPPSQCEARGFTHPTELH